MQILITGSAGFIGFNLARYLLKNKKIKIIGFDNLNDYYSQSLKKDRIKVLKKFKNFSFYKVDLKNKKKLNLQLKDKNISVLIHLAAQAGVRYSLVKPEEFVDNNILAFYNIIDFANKRKIKKVLYASSSSVYGDSKNFPLNEKDKINPKNIYGLSKKINEEIADVFARQFKMSFVGLRFFTLFGEWGRPDMFMIKYLKSSFFNKEKFYLNNFGNHTRDFTYVKDACELIKKLIYKKKDIGNNLILNVSSNRPINLSTVMKKINTLTSKKPIMIKRSLQKADVIKTHGDNKKILNIVGKMKFTNLDLGLKNTVEWFKRYYKI